MRWLWTSLAIFLSPLIAHSEYRAFLLRIQNQSDSQDFRLIPSTLDPLQYTSYYNLPKGYFVTYDSTWMCRDRTNELLEICPDPKRPKEEPSDGPEKQKSP